MTTSVAVQGVVNPDGTLELEERLHLPAGRIQVTVQPLTVSRLEDMVTVLQRIWAEQKARGHVPRTREEIDAELNALRDEAEAEMGQIERFHEQGCPCPV